MVIIFLFFYYHGRSASGGVKSTREWAWACGKRPTKPSVHWTCSTYHFCLSNNSSLVKKKSCTSARSTSASSPPRPLHLGSLLAKARGHHGGPCARQRRPGCVSGSALGAAAGPVAAAATLTVLGAYGSDTSPPPHGLLRSPYRRIPPSVPSPSLT